MTYCLTESYSGGINKLQRLNAMQSPNRTRSLRTSPHFINTALGPNQIPY